MIFPFCLMALQFSVCLPVCLGSLTCTYKQYSVSLLHAPLYLVVHWIRLKRFNDVWNAFVAFLKRFFLIVISVSGAADIQRLWFHFQLNSLQKKVLKMWGKACVKSLLIIHSSTRHSHRVTFRKKSRSYRKQLLLSGRDWSWRQGGQRFLPQIHARLFPGAFTAHTVQEIHRPRLGLSEKIICPRISASRQGGSPASKAQRKRRLGSDPSKPLQLWTTRAPGKWPTMTWLATQPDMKCPSYRPNSHTTWVKRAEGEAISAHSASSIQGITSSLLLVTNRGRALKIFEKLYDCQGCQEKLHPQEAKPWNSALNTCEGPPLKWGGNRGRTFAGPQ